MMHENKRKEKQTEAKQIPVRKLKRNKRIKKDQTSLHLLGIEPATPASLATPPHLHAYTHSSQ
jgi:hypothetical protein